MKKMRKLAAILLAVMMTVGLCATAWADGSTTETTTTGNAITDKGTVEVTTNPHQVTFKNVLKAYNPDETTIYAPAVTYSFTIQAADGTEHGIGTIVTDNDTETPGTQAMVLSGAGGSITIGTETINYTVTNRPSITASLDYDMDDVLTAAAAGADNVQDVTVDFSNVQFSKPGIYRYLITRTVTDNNEALNTIDGTAATAGTTTYTSTRYLDVYVKENNGTRTIYGYVMHKVTTNINKDTPKSDSFDDEYKTSNLIVTKTLVNDASMNSHKFPFNVQFDDTKEAHIKTSNSVTGYSGGSTVGTLAAGVKKDNPTIAHNGAVKYIGIPNGFTAEVYEENDVTGTTYKSNGNVVTSETGDTDAADKSITWRTGSTTTATSDGETSTTTTAPAYRSNTAKTGAATNQNKQADFTNTLEEISPTGVVLRVAPYVLMLAAGLMLLMLSRRRRTALDD